MSAKQIKVPKCPVAGWAWVTTGKVRISHRWLCGSGRITDCAYIGMNVSSFLSPYRYDGKRWSGYIRRRKTLPKKRASK